MKARRCCAWYRLLVVAALMIGGCQPPPIQTSATAALPASMPQQESQENAPCLTIRRETVRFPNGKSVVMLLAQPARPAVRVLSFAPRSQRVMIGANIKQVQGSDVGDLCLCDYNGRVTDVLAPQVTLASWVRWSQDERFALTQTEAALMDTKLRKAYSLPNRSSLSFLWSRVGNCFTYHEVIDKKVAYRVGTITEQEITTRSATREEVIRLMGESFDQVDSLMQEVHGYPGYSTRSGQGRGETILISPDGQRALVQGLIVHRKYTWVMAITSDDTLLTSLVEKGRERAHLLKPPEKTVDYFQWLDAHRWLIGREFEAGETDPTLRLALWDTETGKVWKAPCPRFSDNEVFTFSFSTATRPAKAATRAR